MTLPLAERTSLEAILAHYCRKRCPEQFHDRVKLTFRIEGNIVTLFEKRAYYKDRSRWIDSNVARFRYVKNRNQWELYWRDRNDRWHFYDGVRPNRSIEPLLAEVDPFDSGPGAFAQGVAIECGQGCHGAPPRPDGHFLGIVVSLRALSPAVSPRYFLIE